jgi:hypothetical protein
MIMHSQNTANLVNGQPGSQSMTNFFSSGNLNTSVHLEQI